MTNPSEDIAGSELRRKIESYFLSYSPEYGSPEKYIDGIMRLIEIHDAEKKQQLLAALPGKLKQRKYPDGTFVYMSEAVRAKNKAIGEFTQAITKVYGGTENE